MTPEERLAKCGSAIKVPSIRSDIDTRVRLLEDNLRAHAEWGECPMDGTNPCCDTLVTQLRLMREYAAVVQMYGDMCDRLHAAVTRHELGLGGEHVDELVIEALDSRRSAPAGDGVSDEEASEFPGCLYFVTVSHTIPPDQVHVTAPNEAVADRLRAALNAEQRQQQSAGQGPNE